MKKIGGMLLAALALAGCGGGGGSGGACNGSFEVCSGQYSRGGGGTTTSPFGYVAPPVSDWSTVEKKCAAPRPASILDPYTHKSYGDTLGSLTTEKLWVRSFVNSTYLWYADVFELDPAQYTIGATVNYTSPSDNYSSLRTLKSNYDVVNAYFNSQRSVLTTASGKPKDQFHFTYLTSEWTDLSGSGSSVGFGFNVALVESYPPRKVFVSYTDPGTPAADNHVERGAQFIKVNGVAVSDGSADVLNEGLFSPQAGKSYTFEILDAGATVSRSVTLTPRTVVSTPVQNVHTLAAPYNNVGYIQFNDHIATAESGLIDAVNRLKAANNGAGIKDLVLDLRYNGGGLLDIASELAYMIAGQANTAGKIFEKEAFNDKNPFGMSEADTRTPFHNLTQGFSTTEGQALPQLSLARVYVIAGSGTCSASEAVINGLRGAGVDVVLVGETTCGKPYGFFPQDNCGVTYFTIQFKGVNNVGYGDYADGFVPGGNASALNSVPGCVVADDFSKPLGDVLEARLAAALQYRASGVCGGFSASAERASRVARAQAAPRLPGTGLARPALRENRFYLPRRG
ncbi:MAG: S41 family peptidase [Pseudomonadota bacterium]